MGCASSLPAEAAADTAPVGGHQLRSRHVSEPRGYRPGVIDLDDFIEGEISNVADELLIPEELIRMALHRGSLASVRCEEDVRAASMDWTFITSELGQVTHTEIAQKAEGPQNTLPRNNSYDLTCCVCFEKYNDRVVTKCGHYFCRKCIMSYMKATTSNGPKHCSCPMCRRPVKKKDLVNAPQASGPILVLPVSLSQAPAARCRNRRERSS